MWICSAGFGEDLGVFLEVVMCQQSQIKIDITYMFPSICLCLRQVNDRGVVTGGHASFFTTE